MVRSNLAQSNLQHRNQHHQQNDNVGYYSSPVRLLNSLDPFHKRFYSIRAKIGKHGALGQNRRVYTSIAYQSAALDYVIYGVVNKKPLSVELGLQAILYGFKYQKGDGSFREYAVSSQLSAITTFLVSAMISYQVIQNTPFRFKHLRQLAEIRDRIRTSVFWLHRQHQYQFKQDKLHSSRLAYNALLYGLGAELFNSAELQKTSHDFLKVVLLKQQPNGVFVELDGHDSSYQATTLLQLHYYSIFVKHPACVHELRHSVAIGAAWLKSRVLKSGEVSSMGNVKTGRVVSRLTQSQKGINCIHVIKSLLFYSNVSGDKNSLILARRIFQYLIHKTK